MKRNIASMLGILSIAILAMALPAARADDHPAASIDSANRIVFTSGSLTGVFEGNVPHVKFYATNEMGRSEYMVNFRALIEFAPVSGGEGAYQGPQEIGRATLDSGTWTHSDFYPVKDQNGVTIGMGFNLTLNSAIPIEFTNPGTPATLTAQSVSFAVKAYNSTRTITLNQQTVTINTAEIKIDVTISNWPFKSQNDKLALEVNMRSNYDHFGLDEGTGTQEVDASNPEASSVSEHEFHSTTDQEQNVDFSSGPLTTSSNTGFFRFVKTATVTSPSGAVSTVNVVAAYKGESDKELGDSENFFKLYLAYPYFQGTLTHDPSIGVTGGGIPTLYLVAGGAAAAGLAAVVVIRYKHPRITRETEHK
jgi:hypothetical protein